MVNTDGTNAKVVTNVANREYGPSWQLARRSSQARAASPETRMTGRVELHGAGDQDFSFGLADSQSGSAATRPVSATLRRRGARGPRPLVSFSSAALAATHRPLSLCQWDAARSGWLSEWSSDPEVIQAAPRA